MLNEKVAQLINEQVNKEFYSAYLYLVLRTIMHLKVWQVLQTGIKSRHRKNADTLCCSISTCITTTQLLHWKPSANPMYL